jgi:hypothetical protein
LFTGYGIDRTFGAAVNRAGGRCNATGNRADVDDAAPLSDVLQSGLCRQKETQNVDPELPIKMFLGDILDGGMLVNAGVVYQAIRKTITATRTKSGPPTASWSLLYRPKDFRSLVFKLTNKKVHLCDMVILCFWDHLLLLA